MAARGLRSILQPVLFVGIASMLHGLLFLIPAGDPAKRDSETSRGIRVKTYLDGPRAAVPPSPPASRAPEQPADPAVPNVQAVGSHSELGSDAARDGASRGGNQGDEGASRGAAGPPQGPGVVGGRPPTQSEFGQYLTHLRSEDVQGWARKSARASRQGWKGSSAGSGAWAPGSGSGPGDGTGTGTAGRSGGRTAASFLDPRVRMVIIQYPLDDNGRAEVGKGRNIESRLPPVPYPDLKVKQSRFTSGWWNVYIELWTTKDGLVARFNVLRPETDGPLERVFVDQVKREMQRWAFDPVPSEIHVDVRFYVE